MQVVVKSSALSSSGDVNVICSLNDDVNIDMSAFPAGSVLLHVADSAVHSTGIGQVLSGNWREANKPELIFHEAERRIIEAFPEHSQRNSSHEINEYIMEYGADLIKWPAAARARKAEIDRCWDYVDAIRAKAKQLTSVAMSGDPGQDSKWPTLITPYVPR